MLALDWSMSPESRFARWRRTWMNSTTVWRCTTPVTAARRWRRPRASSARQSPSSSLSLRECRSLVPRLKLEASTAREVWAKMPAAQ
uniref:Uncharacterized protein n=1 Tax=Sphenodon punctatus TaxID=8508 RepID=A0A8D0GVR2_SPHPU